MSVLLQAPPARTRAVLLREATCRAGTAVPMQAAAGAAGRPPDLGRESDQQHAGRVRRRSMPRDRRRQIIAGTPLDLQHHDRRDTDRRDRGQCGEGRDASDLVALFALAAMGFADGRFGGRSRGVAAAIDRRGNRDLRQRHSRQGTGRMSGQYGLRPQQRHEREEPKASAQATVAVSVHGRGILRPWMAGPLTSIKFDNPEPNREAASS